MTVHAPIEPPEDHRVRVARQRRERMRARLLVSVMAVYPDGRNGTPTVIDDVVRHAKVSRGTFYKYFDSLEEAVEELSARLADEMTEAIESVYFKLEEAPMRTATGFLTYLLRSYCDHRWGAFFSHLGLQTEESQMMQLILRDITTGIESGDYCVNSPQIAADLLTGTKIEAIRRIIYGGGTISYILAVTAMVLRSFGLSIHKSDKVVASAFGLLCEHAPKTVAWWQAEKLNMA